MLTAAVAAISDPLIENPSIKRASGLIISITGGKDLMLFEVDEAANRIREEADQDANIIIGASFDESLEGIVRVSVVATGIDNLDPALQAQPAESSLTELAGRLRDDSRQIADWAGHGAPLTHAHRIGASVQLRNKGAILVSTLADPLRTPGTRLLPAMALLRPAE